MAEFQGILIQCDCGREHSFDEWDEGKWKSVCPKCKVEYTFITETIKNIKVLNDKGEVVKSFTVKKPMSRNKIY
jgi:hypothetical protein